MKRKIKKSICLLICFLYLCSSFSVLAAEKEEQIKISNKEYLVTLNDAGTLFISNEKAVSGEIGSKVFLTYTVDTVTKNVAGQNGVVGTTDNTQQYPYQKDGRLDYDNKSILFEQGYTYVYRFERTEQGYAYQCAKLKGEEAMNINFKLTAKNGDTQAYKYYGVWTDGKASEGAGISAILTHVRCYDEKGNDLGIRFSKPTGMIQNEINELLDVHHTVDTHYSVVMDKVSTVAIGNKYPAKTDVIYLEYEVEEVTQDDTITQGVMLVRSLTANGTYPYSSGNGQMLFKSYEQDDGAKPLLKKGAKYFIVFSKQAEGYDAIVQRTWNGKTEILSFPYKTGTYNTELQYVAIWLADGQKHPVSATLKNFKCYDADGNSLGVQASKTAVVVEHHGELEDYSKSQAVYYCKANKEFLVLEDDKIAVKQKGEIKEACTYKIQNSNELYLSFKDGKETYNYTSQLIKDADDNQYQRMKNSKVTFVTGKENIVVEAKADTGYRVEVPESPKKQGHTFKGWYLGDETAFDFENVVTESVIVYAKWQDGDGNEYLAVNQPNTKGIANAPMLIAIVASMVVLGGCTVGCVTIVRKGKKHGTTDITG